MLFCSECPPEKSAINHILSRERGSERRRGKRRGRRGGVREGEGDPSVESSRGNA